MRWFAEECGSWQRPHWPSGIIGWGCRAAGVPAGGSASLWQSVQRAVAGRTSRLGSADAWTVWQRRQSPRFIGPCTKRSVFSRPVTTAWHSAHPGGLTAGSPFFTEMWGEWQPRHFPSRTGACTDAQGTPLAAADQVAVAPAADLLALSGEREDARVVDLVALEAAVVETEVAEDRLIARRRLHPGGDEPDPAHDGPDPHLVEPVVEADFLGKESVPHRSAHGPRVVDDDLDLLDARGAHVPLDGEVGLLHEREVGRVGEHQVDVLSLPADGRGRRGERDDQQRAGGEEAAARGHACIETPGPPEVNRGGLSTFFPRRGPSRRGRRGGLCRNTASAGAPRRPTAVRRIPKPCTPPALRRRGPTGTQSP